MKKRVNNFFTPHQVAHCLLISEVFSNQSLQSVLRKIGLFCEPETFFVARFDLSAQIGI